MRGESLENILDDLVAVGCSAAKVVAAYKILRGSAPKADSIAEPVLPRRPSSSFAAIMMTMAAVGCSADQMGLIANRHLDRAAGREPSTTLAPPGVSNIFQFRGRRHGDAAMVGRPGRSRPQGGRPISP